MHIQHDALGQPLPSKQRALAQFGRCVANVHVSQHAALRRNYSLLSALEPGNSRGAFFPSFLPEDQHMLGFFDCCSSGLRVAADAEPLLCPGRRCGGGGAAAAGGDDAGPAGPGSRISLQRFSPRSWRGSRQARESRALLSRRYASAPPGALPMPASALPLHQAGDATGVSPSCGPRNQPPCFHPCCAGSLAPRQPSASLPLLPPRRPPRPPPHPTSAASPGASSVHAPVRAALLQVLQQQFEAAELAAQRSRLAEPWQAARRRSR